MKMNRRSQTLAEAEFPVDWEPKERETWLEVWKNVRQAKEELKRVVLVTGVFDLLHQEHLNFLRKARAAGNYLVVGIESDSRVRKMKGPDRPVEGQQLRLQKVMDTSFVDEVAILPEAFYLPEHHRSLLALIRPHILAISSHTPYQEPKRQLVELFGGQLRIVHEHNPEVSTSKIIESMN